MTKKKKYTSQFKFKIVLEAIQTNNITETARKYGINGGLLSKWQAKVLENGYLAFGDTQEKKVNDYQKRISQLERIVGQKEVELKLLKNFSDFYESQNTT